MVRDGSIGQIKLVTTLNKKTLDADEVHREKRKSNALSFGG